MLSPLSCETGVDPLYLCLSFPRTAHSFQVQEIIPDEQGGVL